VIERAVFLHQNNDVLDISNRARFHGRWSGKRSLDAGRQRVHSRSNGAELQEIASRRHN
jgi:hypothetical protein